MENILDSLWVEKYRPKEISDLILPEDYSTFFNRCIEKDDIPMTLLIGCPGSGKSTVARIFVDKIIKNDADLLLLNGSDDNGVDCVRDIIIPFLKCPPMQSRIKIVYIDEFDYTTSNMQAALRNVMEKYSDIGRFLCTANYKNKIIDPILSRFQTFEMTTLDEKSVFSYCEKILKNENISYDPQDVKMIISGFNPDVRKIINIIQQNITNGKLKHVNKDEMVMEEKKVASFINLICDSIGTTSQNNSINMYIDEISKIVEKGELDYIRTYKILFDDSNIPSWAKIAVNKYCNAHSTCMLPDIHFTAMIYEIIQNGISFKSSFV